MLIRQYWLEIAFAAAVLLLLAQLFPSALWWVRSSRFHGMSWGLAIGFNVVLVSVLLFLWFKQRRT